ncbi:Ribonuclease J OS=Lysinibacillus sphaericus OX=1421 GN=rnj PE=3 SV=1 [Lysinibacillus sphaericus]
MRKNQRYLLLKVNVLVKATISELQEESKQQLFVLKREIKKAVGQYLFSQTKRKPMILPIIIEI